MKISKELYNKLVNSSINQKQNKYKNEKAICDNIKFDSQKEKNWYIKFKMLEKAGLIKDLKLQVPFELIETFKLNGKTYKKTKYIADFTYYDKDGKFHVVDVKGIKTQVYKLKKKMIAYKYKIEIEEK